MTAAALARRRLATPPDFDFAWVTGFLAPRAVPSLERVTGDAYVRVVRLPGHGVVRLTVARTPRGLAVDAVPALPAAVLRAAVSRLFDLGGDAERFRAHVADDALLGPIVRRHAAVRLPQLLDPFEGLMRAMLGQQVSVLAARTLTDRLVRLLGVPLADAGDDGPTHAFPDAAAVADAPADALRALGVTRVRAAAIRGAAAAVRDGAVDWGRLDALPGVGPWTASYVRMRALGDRDAFPASDLGVVKALARLGVARAAVARHAEAWRPWRAYATVHLWASLADA